MLKIKELLKDLIETQKEINKNLEELNKRKNEMNSELDAIKLGFCDINSSITHNIYTKEETQNEIVKELEYREQLKKVQENNPDLLEFVETISTNYSNMDKYALLDTVEMFASEYIVKKINRKEN